MNQINSKHKFMDLRMFFLILVMCFLSVTLVFAQDAVRVELNGSSLTAGEPFRFTVTVNSDESLSFADAQSWVTAILCPLNSISGSCQTLSMSVAGENSTQMRITFTAEALPEAGDYSLDVSFTDTTGAFAQQSASYLIRGVREGQTVETGIQTPEILIQPASDMPTEVPTEIPAAEENSEPTAVLPDYDPAIPTVTIGVTLVPSISDMSGNTLVYGSTLYVGDSYTFKIIADHAMNDSAAVEVVLPASLASAPVDPSAECLKYLNTDGLTLSIPGSRFNAENNNTFSCELSFTDSTWVAADPVTFRIASTGIPANETYEMSQLSWNYYPVSIAKYTTQHQVQISDSRGNLICSDTVPCGYFNAEDVYVLTYKFPADWSAALPSGKNLTASVSWPEDWALALSQGSDTELASIYGTPCGVDANGESTLLLTETTPGRYSASCTFVPNGISDPRQVPAKVHLNDTTWSVNDLSVYMPGTIVKTQAVLSPSLTLRMTENSAAVEQIQGGTISRLYRTSRDYPNTANGSGAPALYTLQARIEGVSSSRTPQPGDVVTVNWNLLDVLAQAGDLPFCLTPSANGYVLGNLQQTADGSWEAHCDFRFPQTISENTYGDRLEMQLLSGVYQTSAYANMNEQAFRRGTINVVLDIPTHMLLNQATALHVSLTDESGSFSDYLRAILTDTGVDLTSTWIYNYVTSCQGTFLISENGTSECNAYFESPADSDSTMHFNLLTSAQDHLFTVKYSPSQDIQIHPISNISAELTTKLYHAGSEMNLPAAVDDAFIAGDDYQLQFTLTPDAAYRDVLDAVAVDGEGLVMDWWEPLLIRWAALPGGSAGVNFYRDGDHFAARYDFSFSEGDISLEGGLGQMVVEASISGWDIHSDNYLLPVQMPSYIAKKPVSLEISDFLLPGSTETVTDLHVNETAEFSVSFIGSMNTFDLTALQVGYDANGIRTPIACVPDYDNSVLNCTITAQCTDYAVGTYSSVCGTNLSIYAEYAGDPGNNAAAADPKVFNVKRGDLYFTPKEDGSLSMSDLYRIYEANGDLTDMTDSVITVGGWKLDSYLPRKVIDMNGAEYRSYPVIFNYRTDGDQTIDQTKLWLDVTYETGVGQFPQEQTISLKPRMVTNDTIWFELDFGSFELLADGRTVQNALEEAVTIKSLTVHYSGDSLISESKANYTAADLTFALKVADHIDLQTDMNLPGFLQFGGAYTGFSAANSFTVYCTQMFEPLECAVGMPEIAYDADGNLIESDFADDGCWGNILLTYGTNGIFTSNAWNPVCYLTAWDSSQKILVASNQVFTKSEILTIPFEQ